MRLAALVSVLLGAAVPLDFALAQIQVLGGNPVISITSGTPGGSLIPAANSTCTLRWRRENVVTRITVSASCPGQRFSLSVAATNITSGIAAPQVNLMDGMTDANLITSIPPGNPPWKTCTLVYTASATFEQGNSTELGNDSYLITYTLVAP
jgi:hypothetical protein